MKRFVIAAALLGLSNLPALAKGPARAQQRGDQPVTLTDAQLDSVTGGDLLGLNLNSLLTTVNSTLQTTLGGLNTSGLLGLQGTSAQGTSSQGTTQQQPPASSLLGGLLTTTTGVLSGLGL